MAQSNAHRRFLLSLEGSDVLRSFAGVPVVGRPQILVDQTCLVSAVASAVGSWEGFLEDVIKEFVAKTRVFANSRAWPLIAQFEIMVAKAASDLNTPSWDKARDILHRVTGVDPYASWIWTSKFATQTDTKEFFDGLMVVRHSFAHGFPVPLNIPALSGSGHLTATYVAEVLDCLKFFALTTDGLLEHELKHKHGSPTGW